MKVSNPYGPAGRTHLKSLISAKFILIPSIFVFLVLSLSATVVFAIDPLANLTLLVENDRGLLPDKKKEWLSIIQKHFKGKRFSFDYSRLVYGILSEAKFNGVDMNRAGRVAFDSTIAVAQGGPVREVAELALFAFSEDLTSEKIRFYADILQKCNSAGLPDYVVQEMMHTSKREDWPAKTFTTIMEGLIKAARQNLDVEKVALFMLISIAQNLGSPAEIVRDAIKDAGRRAWEKLQRATKAPVETPFIRKRKVAIDFDSFQRSVESFLGTPYFWGGNSRFGVDCSGFTKLVMQANGYRIPRVSRDQAKVGRPVAKDEFNLGDLIFFDTKNEGRINHVGLYLGGNLMAHASSSKGVTIVLFSDRYFQSRFVSGRRIVNYFK
ncbi:C40 family peptidase [Thermodesulfobacteriota bacterium]